MTTAHTARPPRRKIIGGRSWDSRFKVGQHVTIDGAAAATTTGASSRRTAPCSCRPPRASCARCPA